MGIGVLFWTDRWLRGVAMEDVAPDVFSVIRQVVRARRNVADALTNGA